MEHTAHVYKGEVYKPLDQPEDGGFAYGHADANRNVQPVSPSNSLPMLVLWLFVTTDPGYMRSDGTDEALNFSYEKVASALNLSLDYVKFFFKWAHQENRAAALNAVNNLFLDLLGSGDYVPGGAGGSCAQCDLILKFAPVAREVWNAPENQPRISSASETK